MKFESLQLTEPYRFSAGVTTSSPSVRHTLEKFDMTFEPSTKDCPAVVRVVRIGHESAGEDFIPWHTVVGFRKLKGEP